MTLSPWSMHFRKLLALYSVLVLAHSPPVIYAQASAAETLKQWWSGPIQVCVSDLAPMAMCSAYGNDTSLYTGFHVELFRKVAKQLGYNENDYYFTCMDWTPMIDDLSSANGSCHVAPTGLDVAEEYLSDGIKFTFPSFKSGLKVLVAASSDTRGMWYIYSAMNWTVWISLALTGPLTGFILWGMEKWQARSGAIQNTQVENLRDIVWRVVGKMVDIGEPDANTWPARIVMLAYGFLCIMTMSLFTANTAALITEDRLKSLIRGKQDLVGKKVGCWYLTVPILAKYSITGTGFPWENAEDLSRMVAALERGTVDALVLDAPVVDYIAKNSSCQNFHSAGGSFENFQLSFAFPSSAPQAVLDIFSMTMAVLQRDYNLLDELEGSIVSASSCNYQSSADRPITLRQVASLWILLGCAIASSFVVVQIERYQRRHKVMEHVGESAVQAVNTVAERMKNGSSLMVAYFSRHFMAQSSRLNGLGESEMVELSGANELANMNAADMEKALQVLHALRTVKIYRDTKRAMASSATDGAVPKLSKGWARVKHTITPFVQASIAPAAWNPPPKPTSETCPADSDQNSQTIINLQSSTLGSEPVMQL